jgi:hypothetical protein
MWAFTTFILFSRFCFTRTKKKKNKKRNNTNDNTNWLKCRRRCCRHHLPTSPPKHPQPFTVFL